MAYRPLDACLFRMPLLPLAALAAPAAALLAHPLGKDALDLASPDLAEALRRTITGAAGKKRRQQRQDGLARFGARAAFRPTPAGWLAAVAMGRLATRTDLDTSQASWHRGLRPSWARLVALGRSLLDEPEVRLRMRLRLAPSVLLAGSDVLWLAPDPIHHELQIHRAPRDELLQIICARAREAVAWPVLRQSLLDDPDDGPNVDDYLATLVDQGLLHHDLMPPLITAAGSPSDWMSARLAALGTDLCAPLPDLTGLSPAAARTQLAALPGVDPAVPALHGELALTPARPFHLSRRAIERAATVAPLLHRLQQALAPPVLERELDASLAEQLAGVAEIFGEGAYSLRDLGGGSFGSVLSDGELAAPPVALASHFLPFLVHALAETARCGGDELVLEPDFLDRVLPPARVCPTLELVVSPARSPARAAPGTDWLLGLHGPAGASWGRFADLLGEEARRALQDLAQQETLTRPSEVTMDVAFAASPLLADLGCHPAVRARTLALTHWSDPAAGTPVTLADLDLILDAAGVPLALRQGDQLVRPSPCHRVRSTTAPPGLYALLAGWSFARQHAPWGFIWGPLATLPRLPRVRLAGFVIAPASWRIPDVAELTARGGVQRWRAEAAVPRWIQVGEGDELLPIDLQGPGAVKELVRHAEGRAHEIWPPLDRLPDVGGRRVEAVVALVDHPDPEEGRREQLQGESLPAIPTAIPPQRRVGSPTWLTFKIFGAAEWQDEVLLQGLTSPLESARAAGEINRWFFLRYVDPPGARHHLRLRVRPATVSGGVAFARRLERSLHRLRLGGQVVQMERTDYVPEESRYGAAHLAQVEEIFCQHSALVLQILTLESSTDDAPIADRLELTVRSWDILTRALGFDLTARHARAARHRQAHQREEAIGLDEALASAYRTRARRLMEVLADRQTDLFSPSLSQFGKAVAEVAQPGLSAAAEAGLLHMVANRLLGLRAEDERAAVTFWARALEGLVARQKPHR